MPISITRRDFLAATAAAGVAVATSRLSFAQIPGIDQNRFALISDSHINALKTKVDKDVNMADNLKAVVAAITSLRPQPGTVIHGGDLAHIAGERGDYTVLSRLLRPLLEQGMSLHVVLGNHDNRTNYLDAVPTELEVEQKYASMGRSPHADWYFLDSLDRPNITPGVLGEKQLAWLARRLDKSPDRNAIIVTHHHPIDQPRPFPGLTDTRQLLDVILPRRQVKLLVYGHTHDYGVFPAEGLGLHRINLPPTAYVFAKDRPSGWIDCMLTPTGGTFKLMALDEKHPQHGHTTKLTWR